MPTLDELRKWATGEKVSGMPQKARQCRVSAKVSSQRMMERLNQLRDQTRLVAGRKTTHYKIADDGENALILFGKHNGKTLDVIMQEDPTYLDWMLRHQDGGGISFDTALLDVVQYVQESHWKKMRDERVVARASVYKK
jgi:hypothetical protein